MKQKLIIILSVFLLLGVIAIMVYDLFFEGGDTSGNPYEYNLDDLRKVDENLICYQEIDPIKPDIAKPHAVAVDANDRIYVGGDGKLKVFDADGNVVDDFKIDGTINCLAIGEDGKLFLGITDHIEVMDRQGKLLEKWDALNDRVFITSIAEDESSVFVADAGNKIVYRYNRDGLLLNTIGKKDKEQGIPGFIIPSPYFDLAIGREGQLWVVNPGLHTFEAYNRDGDLFSSWTKTSMQIEGFSGCCNPGNFALLADGSFVTSEKGIERVKIHLPSGEFKCVVAAPESFEEGTIITDLAVDSHGRILVLDPRKGLIRIFEGK
jgi:sugar lactone lactonase YvrE